MREDWFSYVGACGARTGDVISDEKLSNSSCSPLRLLLTFFAFFAAFSRFFINDFFSPLALTRNSELNNDSYDICSDTSPRFAFITDWPVNELILWPPFTGHFYIDQLTRLTVSRKNKESYWLGQQSVGTDEGETYN